MTGISPTGRRHPSKVVSDQTLGQLLIGQNPAVGGFLQSACPAFQINVGVPEALPQAVPGQPGRYSIGRTGLVADVRLECFDDLGVVRQCIRLTNEGPTTGPEIGEINVFFLPLKVRLKDSARACHTGGGLTDGFYPPRAWRVHSVSFGKARQWDPARTNPERWWTGRRWYSISSNPEGRSSNPDFPLMVFDWQADGAVLGVWAAMEWSGRWEMAAGTQAHFHWAGGWVRHEGIGEDWEFVFRGGPRGIRMMVLEPGEALDLPPVNIGVYGGSGATRDDAFNSVRRYVAAAILPDVEGRRPLPVLAYSTWFGIHQDIGDAMLRTEVDRAAELGLEYFEIDAGWYGNSTDNFANGVGNWERVDSTKFPQGLEDFAQYVKSKGLRFGLWFEPERGREGSDWVTQHPDWYWKSGGPNYHLDLTRQEVQDGLIEMLSRWVERLDIRYLRWDCNQAHGPFWDRVDPTGKVQFAYMKGLYRVFDTLLQRHPNLLIENCAGGGQRTDLGILRYSGGSSVISDHAEDPHICRIMQTGGARFLPGNVMNSSIYMGRDDGEQAVGTLELMSRMAGAITLNGCISTWSARHTRRVRRYLDGFRTYRHLLMKDFHALTPYPYGDEAWDVVQFIDPVTTEAIVLAYRVAGPDRIRTIHPRRLDPQRDYEIVDPFSTSKGRRVGGAELMGRGLRLTLDKDSAAARHLKPVD